MSNAFNRLGRAIVRRYKAIIAVWIIALLFAIPFVPYASDAVVYDDTEDPGINGQPSVQAQAWISEHFSNSIGRGSVIIVLTADDVTSIATADLVAAITNELNKASPIHSGELQANATVTSVYSVTSAYSLKFLYQVNLDHYVTYNMTEVVQSMLFGLPEEHLAAWEAVNSSAGPSVPTWQKDILANEIVSARLTDRLVNATYMGEEQRSLFLTYDQYFDIAWSATANDSLSSDPALRMADASAAAFSELMAASSVTMSKDVFRLLNAVHSSFDLATWQDPVLRSEFANGIVSSSSLTEPWLARAAAAYGPVEVNGQMNISVLLRIEQLARGIVSNRTIGDFPLPLIPASISAFVNVPANDTTILLVTMTDNGQNVEASAHDLQVIRAIVAETLDGRLGYGYYVTGNDAVSADMTASVDQDVARIDPITILLVLVLIGLFFRSPVTSSIPPTIIGISLGMSFAAVYLVGTYVMALHYSLLTLIVTATLGAGCDYCIFVISRYREERRRGADKQEAVETSVTWAGEAIATSGATVIVGFGALVLGHLQVVKSLGLLAFSIFMALLIALTFLPSLLMLIGDRIFWPTSPMKAVRASSGYFTKSARFAIKHAKAIVAVAVLVSLPATFLVLTTPTSYDYIQAMPDTESREGLVALEDGFGGGTIDPTPVGVSLSVPLFNGTGGYDLRVMDEIEALCRAYAALPEVRGVTGPTRPYGVTIAYAELYGNTSISARLYDQYIRASMVGDDNRSVRITIVMAEEPFSTASIESIKGIRQVSEGMVAEGGAIDGIFVSGATARTYDISTMTQQDMVLIISVVLLAIFLILMVVLRSVFSPLKSILTILLSISWTLAITLLFFNHVMNVQVMWMVPMVLVVVCLGLGLDYDILLITRIREETQKGMDDNEAIVHAVESTGGIITTCGIIMAAAFGSMMLSNGSLLREFGFALMLAILIDATLVRIYLVPAIMSLMGKWNWWMPFSRK